MARVRLDQALVSQGLCESREQAKRLVLAGEVLVNGEKQAKPGTPVALDADFLIKQRPRYVGRGGLKMEGALRHFGVDPTGWVALDIGASTGGFTDCLIQHGASRVYAFDVGTNQLAWKIRSDSRVVSKENYNVRHLRREDIGEPLDLIVADVSFISLTLVLPPALKLLKPNGQSIVLVKPQFELSRDQIGPGGIVRDPSFHQQACDKIQHFIETDPDLQWKGLMESPIQGGDGNREFLMWFAKVAQ